MGRKSVFAKMRPEVRETLDAMIVGGHLTIDEMHAFLAEKKPEELGLEAVPSRSTVGRHVASFKEVADRMRQERELASALAQELSPESVAGDQGRMLVEILRTFLSNALRARINDPASVDLEDINRLSRSIKDMSQAMRLEQDFERKIREEAEKTATARAATAAGEAARGAGIAEEEVSLIMQSITRCTGGGKGKPEA